MWYPIRETRRKTSDLVSPGGNTSRRFLLESHRGWLFGVGGVLTGACAGPLYALAGSGYPAFAAALFSAIGGALVYGLVRDKLPH